ncbi:hypothetical protein Cni_G01560 [Canna indica]|uniref:Retropepsins domain-containing protein n=1 Tax=Canna indica TaxID=4628 RepID=A0AAQ3JMU5_9LILI|nr:hypothetical protein Cni_G01560 [Canna indica]
MSDWNLTAASLVYKEALKATDPLGTPAEGFVKPALITTKHSESIFKQLNTLIQLTCKIKEQLDELAIEVKQLKLAKEKASPQSIADSIDSLAKDLQKLKIGDSSEKKTLKPPGKLYVFKDPRISDLPQEFASIADKVDQPKGKRVLNRLYNMTIIMEIPQVKSFRVQAILDTGATVCCIDQDSIPEEALEPSAYPIMINGVNSQQMASKKLKNGYMSIEENRFSIPFT